MCNATDKIPIHGMKKRHQWIVLMFLSNFVGVAGAV